eukprot:6925044-Prymnesium_polylepis.1
MNGDLNKSTFCKPTLGKRDVPDGGLDESGRARAWADRGDPPRAAPAGGKPGGRTDAVDASVRQPDRTNKPVRALRAPSKPTGAAWIGTDPDPRKRRIEKQTHERAT